MSTAMNTSDNAKNNAGATAAPEAARLHYTPIEDMHLSFDDADSAGYAAGSLLALARDVACSMHAHQGDTPEAFAPESAEGLRVVFDMVAMAVNECIRLSGGRGDGIRQ